MPLEPALVPVATPPASTLVEQELEDFIYMVSHDMAASIRHVTEFSKLLHKDLGPSLTLKQEGYASRVLVAGGRCQDMMEQLLIFSRAQQKLLDCAAQDPAMLARVAVLQLRSENPELVAEINIEPLCVVIADRTLLSLVLRHLLDNAIRFARPGVPAVIQVSTHLTPTMWVLSIADNGMGVAPEYRETVFRMFRRLNAEDAYPGPGVGLPLCRRIARRHGGDVRFVDCPTGARVTLTLPRALNRTDEAANSPAP